MPTWLPIARDIALLLIPLILEWYRRGNNRSKRWDTIMSFAELAWKVIEVFKLNNPLGQKEAFKAFTGQVNSMLAKAGMGNLSGKEISALDEWAKMRSTAGKYNKVSNGSNSIH